MQGWLARRKDLKVGGGGEAAGGAREVGDGGEAGGGGESGGDQEMMENPMKK